MKKGIVLLGALLISATIFGFTSSQTNQDISQGTDSELFLNPYIELALKEVSGQVILDAGCGSAPHAIMAAKNGATVCVIEPKKQLLNQVQDAIQKAGMESQISFYENSLEKLPFSAGKFDSALCVNIPRISSTKGSPEESSLESNFKNYFCEIARVMKEKGHLVIVAPASYGVVFSDGSRPEDAVYQHIEQVLSKIGKISDTDLITEHLSELEEVMRATFVLKNEQLKLVTNEKDLYSGQQIWCKIPNGIISSVYHSEEEYLIAFKLAGLTCEEIKRPCFFGKVKYDMWKASPHVCGKSLGEAYTENHPFTIYYVVK